ncbi:MAG: DUF3047 domain-containing protein [Candidatus Tantalella remota]|nr:DUF3047 domain-containing protein [Candidatus Tantalella remota]
MKLRGIFFIAVPVIVAVAVITIGGYVFMIRGIPFASKGPAGEKTGKKEIIKNFDFSSASQLKEWEEKNLAEDDTGYETAEYGGKSGVKAESANSASALYFKHRLNRERDPFLSWKWRAGEFPSYGNEDLGDKDEFDFVAQVYVIFQSKFFLNTKAIQYVWTRDIPEGTVAQSPYTKNVRLLVLESGPSEEWKHEDRDIKSDFEELFGENLEKDVAAVAFMTDSDSTDSEASAFYTDISIGYLGSKEEDVQAKKKKMPGEVEVKKRVTTEE